MTEAEMWRDKAQEWRALAKTSPDPTGFRVPAELAAEAMSLADELDAEENAPLA
jgi:predicted phage gp36 major capsid-like protein